MNFRINIKRTYIILLVFFMIVWDIYAEKIKPHFKHLPLMMEEAKKDGNDRSVKNIAYILETPSGEYFEVDNDKLPIESVVYKLDHTKQHKPLQEKKDEDLLITYFHKVEKYASRYFTIVEGFMYGYLTPTDAESHFIALKNIYPGFSATYRAIGLTSLASGNSDNAVKWNTEAININTNDYKALLLLSITEYARLNKKDSLSYWNRASWVKPKVTSNFWELNYIMNEVPDVYEGWIDTIGVDPNGLMFFDQYK